MSAQVSRPGWETWAANETQNSDDTSILQAPRHPMLETALNFHAHGISVVKVAADGSKRPLGAWKEYQDRRATDQELNGWFSTGHPAIGERSHSTRTANTLDEAGRFVHATAHLFLEPSRKDERLVARR